MIPIRLIYLGSEIPSNRTLLTRAGVTELGVAFDGLSKRVRKDTENLLANFPDDQELRIHALPGIAPDKQSELSEDELRAFAAEYELFLSSNTDRLASWVEFDCTALGPEWALTVR